MSASDVYIQLSSAHVRLLSLCSTFASRRPYWSVTSSFVSACRSPFVSFISHKFGGSPTSTPWSSTFSARGATRPSANTVRLSMRPSPLVSWSTTMRPTGSCTPWSWMSVMYPAISMTHIRPSASQSMRIGSTTRGSLATSST